MSEPLRYEMHPTDVVVCLKGGVWNLTKPDEERPGRLQRAILRGLVQAAMETLDEWDSPKHDLAAMQRLQPVRVSGRSQPVERGDGDGGRK